MNCWEVIKCSEKSRKSCPAYPDRGSDCWKITGCMCKGGTMQMTTLTDKLKFCKECVFYKEYSVKS